jgi:surfeit locus 1 family protein
MAPPVIKSFRPSVPGTLVLFLLAILFATLGMWQSKRGAEKVEIEQQFENAGVLQLEEAMANRSRFSRIDVSGHYDTSRHILLDNQVWQGRAGIHVFTPFYTVEGTTIMVNRGWLPLSADRKVMPDIPTPQHETALRGILNIFPVPGRTLGPADELQTDKWPQLVTYLDRADISVSLESPLAEWIVQLSKSEQAGFGDRDWKPVFLTSSKHRGYAFQWYSLAGICIVLWIFNSFRTERGSEE